jgi:lysophospholipase L1-like esterase
MGGNHRILPMRTCHFFLLLGLVLAPLGGCSDETTGDGSAGGSGTASGATGGVNGGGGGVSGAITGGTMASGGAAGATGASSGVGGSNSGSGGALGGLGGANGAGASGLGPGGALGGAGGPGGIGGSGIGGNAGGAAGVAGAVGAGGRGGASGAAGGGRGGAGTSGAGGTGVPGVRIVGRTATGTMGPRFSWPGVSIVARFSGTQASIQLSDASNTNRYEVIVDGTRRSTLVTVAGQSTYPLVSGLANTTHDLVVWRRTEAYYNPTEFVALTGFSAGGALLPPPPAPDRRIEIVGDSISAGYGIEGTPTCSGSQTNENNYLAYGSVAARALGADLYTIAWSGIGMWRNYNEAGPSADAMPARYDRTIGADAASTANTWDFSKYQPHIVVINLSSNDYSTRGDPGQPYVTAFTTFVRHVRSVYPNAYIMCLIQWNGSATNINSVVNTIRTGGDTRIESFDINVSAGGDGCEGHPNVAKAQAMGDRLATEIRRVLGW